MNPLMMQIPAGILGSIMGAKLANLAALPASVVSPRISRAILAAGVLGGGVGAWQIAGGVADRYKKKEEAALDQLRQIQFGGG